MRMTVVGATGQLGRDLVAEARDAGLSVTPLGHTQIEVTDPASVLPALQRSAPDIVVNCVAFVQVDECEQNPVRAFRVNAVGAMNVARAAARIGARCVYVSTDYVFDGARDDPYGEDDLPGPINVYGASKLAGEHLVRQSCPDSLIVRVAGLYGRHGARGKGGNFVESVLRKAVAGERLRVVADSFTTPTYTRHASRAILSLLADGAGGVVHLAGRGSVSWYEFARRALKEAGVEGRVQPIRFEDYAGVARRPRNSALTTRRSGRFRRALKPWQCGLAEYLTETGRLGVLQTNEPPGKVTT